MKTFRFISLCTLYSVLSTFYSLLLSAQTPGEWTWMSGDSVLNSSGVFGTQGMASTYNNPPALYQGCGVTDQQGNFWLFGGANFKNNGEAKTYDALWKYNGSTNEWTWMKGYSSSSHFGSYGVQGIADSNSTPGTRYGATMWMDSSNSIWLFGGIGFASGNAFIGYGYLNDLWKYNLTTNEWTWVKGSDDAAAGFNIPQYGTKGIADSINTPNGRWQCDSWIDQENNLWLFGGYNNETAETGYYNDLWRYNISSNEWTWMKGDSLPGQLGSFGTLGIADSNNNPSARTCQAHWVDSSGNLWLFGGAVTISSGIYQDIWQYDIAANNWIWWGGFGGTNSYNADTGIVCLSFATNWPEAREEISISWLDKQHNFWLFGGFGYPESFIGFAPMSELWKFDLPHKIWTRISGKDHLSADYYGIQGMSSFNNKPSSRFGYVSFQDTAGDFWFFGGTNDLLPNEQSPCFNDLWRYVRDSTCGVYTEVNEIAESEKTLKLYPNPTTGKFTMEFSQQNGNADKVTIQVRSFMGALLQTEYLVLADGWLKQDIDLNEPAGIYLVTICTSDCYTRKIIITK